MTQKKPKQDSKSEYNYRIVGYVFLAIGFAMFFSETSRGLAIAFFAIGIAFIVIRHDDDSKRKSDKK